MPRVIKLLHNQIRIAPTDIHSAAVLQCCRRPVTATYMLQLLQVQYCLWAVSYCSVKCGVCAALKAQRHSSLSTQSIINGVLS